MSKARAAATLLALLLAAPASAGTYTLKWGDTVAGVARRFGVSINSIAEVNGIADANKVVAGRTLKIPAPGATPGSAAPAMQLAVATQPSAGAGAHMVSAGETLSGIARRYGTTTRELMALNGITDANLVRIGRELAVPGAAVQWSCPVAGADRWSFVNGFGTPRKGGKHMGIDIFARRGTHVRANVSGILKHVKGANAGNGYYLDGVDGLVYYGAHLDGYLRPPGPVGAGEAIGTVGTSGNAEGTPAHLHFSMERRDGTILNPYDNLRAAC